jgi:hypothetical protein
MQFAAMQFPPAGERLPLHSLVYFAGNGGFWIAFTTLGAKHALANALHR